MIALSKIFRSILQSLWKYYKGLGCTLRLMLSLDVNSSIMGRGLCCRDQHSLRSACFKQTLTQLHHRVKLKLECIKSTRIPWKYSNRDDDRMCLCTMRHFPFMIEPDTKWISFLFTIYKWAVISTLKKLF